jgi:hypothetical protein
MIYQTELLSFPILYYKEMNAWSRPSTPLRKSFSSFDVETCLITRFWHPQKERGFKCLEIKKIPWPPISLNSSSSFRLIYFLLSFFLSIFLSSVGCATTSWHGRLCDDCRFSLCIFLKTLKIDRNKNRKETSVDRHKLAAVDAPCKLKRIGRKQQ